jgi:hypothetical protein
MAGFAAFNGLALALGLGLLASAGAVRPRLASIVPAAGAAFVVGVATIGSASAVALVLGAQLDAAVLSVVVVLATAVSLGIGLWRWRRADDRGPADRWWAPVTWLLVAVMCAFTLAQVALSRHLPIAWDAAHIWTAKAISIATTGNLDGQLFSEHSRLPASHQDYPLVEPVLGAILFRFTAVTEQGILIGELWLLLGAAMLAVLWLCRPTERAWLAVVPLTLALAAITNQGVLRGDADVPMACFLMVGAVSLARLLETAERGYALPAALCLAAAANTKNEGLVFVLALLACALVFALRRRPVVLTVGAVGLVVALLAAPWRLWVHMHGPFASDITPLSRSLSPSFLADHLVQLDLGAQQLLGHFGDPAYGWLVPAFLVVVPAALAGRRATRLAGFYLAAVLAVVLALCWVYWTSEQVDVGAHIARTALRTVTAPLFLAAAALSHLLPQLVPERPLADPETESVGAAGFEPATSRV